MLSWKRILFTSRLQTADSDEAEVLLRNIANGCLQRNKQHGLNASLYCNPDTFNLVYLMEGPVQAVNALFENIAKDPRHTRVSRLINQDIEPQSSWLSEEIFGFRLASNQEFAALRQRAGEGIPSVMKDVEAIDLETIDSLPLVGELDLSLIRIIYKSKLVEQDEHRAFLQMQAIVEHAQLKNERLLIGGVLLMNSPSMVVQCLEGPSNVVKALYKSIESDPRHKEVEFLLLEKISKRRYKSWGMAWASQEAAKQVKESLEKSGKDGVI